MTIPGTEMRPAPRVAAVVVDGPLTRDAEAAATHGRVRVTEREGGVGAAVRFEGLVRRGEPRADAGGVERDLEALFYQTYDPMAERELLALARSVAERHGLTGLVALHSRGRVAVGETSFVLVVESAHRAEALAAMAEFIDRMKQDVPIWKRPIWR